MKIGLLTLDLRLAASHSLKAKRNRAKALMSKMQKRFNVSVAEVRKQNKWQTSILACVLVGSDGRRVQKSLQRIVQWLEREPHDAEL